MKVLCCIVAAAGLLAAVPALAQEAYDAGGGASTSLWSGAQGTSFSYGTASGFGTSSSGSSATAGGLGSLKGVAAGAINSAITTSYAATTSNGSGYAQTQTSGYAGGNVSGFAARGH